MELCIDFGGSEIELGILDRGDPVRTTTVPAGDVAAPIEAYVREHLWTSSHRPAFVIPDRPDLSVLRGLSVLAAENHPKRSARANR